MTAPILVLLVNFHHEDEVLRFVERELHPQAGVRLQTIVCDNGSADPADFRKRAEALHDVLYFSTGDNSGYFGAAARALDDHLAKGNSLPEWVVVSNTDVHLPAGDFFSNFFRLAEGALVAAPAVWSSLSGHQQNPFSEARYSLPRLKLLRLIYSSYPLYLVYQALAYLKRALRRKRTADGTVREVYALHGTFLAFNRNFFLQGGSLRFGAFLFGEELFVAEQVMRMGAQCRYIPELQLEHREHASTGLFKSRKLVRYLYQSTDYLIREVYRG